MDTARTLVPQLYPRQPSLPRGCMALLEFSFLCSHSSVNQILDLLSCIYVTLSTLAIWLLPERFSEVQFYNCSYFTTPWLKGRTVALPHSHGLVWVFIKCSCSCHKTRRRLWASFQAVCVSFINSTHTCKSQIPLQAKTPLPIGENCHNKVICKENDLKVI